MNTKYWLITYQTIPLPFHPEAKTEVCEGEWINFISSRNIKTILFLKEITEEEYSKF
jgi:hypothetical protein